MCIEKMFPDCVDASFYPDVQELLFSSDILLTDYSSTMFDFMYSQKPCFLYTPDRKEYDRGYYWNIDELPFPAFCNNEEINSTVTNFSDDIYQEKLIGIDGITSESTVPSLKPAASKLAANEFSSKLQRASFISSINSFSTRLNSS